MNKAEQIMTRAYEVMTGQREAKYYLGFGFGSHRIWVKEKKKTYMNKFLDKFTWRRIDL